MSKFPEGVSDPTAVNVVARKVLLDGLEALSSQSDAVTVVGAQAVYLRSVEIDLVVASFTSDADLGIDPTHLSDMPLIEEAMRDAGFARNGQPGQWTKSERVGSVVTDIAVDLLVPESYAGSGSRSVEMPPHDRMAARRVDGLEAAVVDFDVMEIAAFDPADTRRLNARVAGPAALLIAKAHKIDERAGEAGQTRLTDKDAGDVIRLMLATDEDEAVSRFEMLLANQRARAVTEAGLRKLRSLFGAAATLGTTMAARALAGDPVADQVQLVGPAFLQALPTL